MNPKYIIHIFLGIFLFSCTREDITLNSGYVTNPSSHTIKIIPYFSGNTFTDKQIILNPGETKQIGRGFDRGIVQDGGFHSDYFGGPDDSLIVVFDNIYRIAHYANTPQNLNPKHYLFSSLRNIGNPKSYELDGKNINKHKRENKYTYTFTEQDYLDAK